ncbi:MAG: glycosyltransferase family 2 protein [Candidatus Andersenbacteria bacterium]
MTQVSIAIVNWNTGELLAKCVQSLLNVADSDRIAEIIVVDNASTDTSFAKAQAEVRGDARANKVIWIPLKTNAGFAKANNLALQRIHERHPSDSAHVLLLNPDTKVSSGALQQLLAVLDRNPQAGIVGPKLLNTDGTHQPSVRAFPTGSVLTVFFLKLARLLPLQGFWGRYLQTDFDYTKEQPTDQVMGAAFLIRNSLLDPKHAQYVGRLDEAFFVWFEEVDYCRRAKASGWQTVYTPLATITHHGGASFAQLLGVRRVLPYLKSALHYSRKHLSLLTTIILFLLLPISVLLAVPAALVHMVFRQQNKVRLKGTYAQ